MLHYVSVTAVIVLVVYLTADLYLYGLHISYQKICCLQTLSFHVEWTFYNNSEDYKM